MQKIPDLGARALCEENGFQIEHPLLHVDGRDIWFEHQVRLVTSRYIPRLPCPFAPQLHLASAQRVFLRHECQVHPDAFGASDRTQVIVISRDISDRRERHRLENENARLVAARKADGDAMHFLSHELKNRFIAGTNSTTARPWPSWPAHSDDGPSRSQRMV